ncbi:alkanesulfonate monooxygenase SsuD/methylene tetrahydromethanopterin reductase-like flavin-dependent oxidoreductase (luciferase family) [Micromonospora sp. Llam0]|uniref:LLM class flavin-dependent oxidoreductase n=1 Tax=Micromonospora sp. Llam0 TaxID=2485143 RepID=UPI000F463239|nr:LLM class flavin-dependent oxidoreductase [Micromonospora sp. Llam0]ROO60118.1 alkanesulfonate monooxygenase SsuD/methylene tetrahydromethanopterin reductase-like flavin-dependent oxidoreductase (luciferase family) [Micromonospora sp. Llam0]
MKFALMYEIAVPRPWDDRSAYVAFQNVLDQIVLADKLGFHSVWTVEHHFLDEYSFSSAPGVLYGAIAAKTKNIRIGHGVRLLPFPYNHPVRAAEAAATVDVLSGGRLEFGTGRSGTRTELEGFGIDPTDTRPMWEEALEVIMGCWTQEEFSWDGEHFKLPPRGVVPKPMQRPHPPLWGASSSADSHELIGEKGLGLLSFSVAAAPETLVKRFNRYRDGIRRAKPVGAYVNEQIATFTQVHCAQTTEEAYAAARDCFGWYVQTSLKSVAELGDWKDGAQLGSYEYARKLLGGIDLDSLTFDYLVDNDAVIVGNPDQCVEMAKRYEAVGTDLLLCLVQPYNIPHEKVMKSIELLGKHVLPEFS